MAVYQFTTNAWHNGKLYRNGDIAELNDNTVPRHKNGEIAHVVCLDAPVEDEVKEIKEKLREKGIAFHPAMGKTKLLALLNGE